LTDLKSQEFVAFIMQNSDLPATALRMKVAEKAAILVGLVMVACPVGAQSVQLPHFTEPQIKVSNAEDTVNPIADPKAVVVIGHARFTVLTPEMVRMEWAQDSKFEDHASFVFINRRLAVPDFEKHIEQSNAGQTLTLKTDALELKYTAAAGTDGKLNAEDLSIQFTLNGMPHTWHPGLPDVGNLLGTTRTLDGARGEKTKEPIEPGLISRDGWTLVDDSTRPLFDSANFKFSQGEQSPWPWVMLRVAGDRQDWYFFGYGHNYKQALGDYVRVAGRIPLPPRFVFGAWWSRYWAYSDQELNDLVHGFRENDIPLDVLVIDMDWHVPVTQLQGKQDQSGQRLGWTGYTWNKTLFPDPRQFLKNIHAEGLKVTLNMHPASGVQPWEEPYPEMARSMGIDPATKKYVPFDITSKKYATNYIDILHHPLEKEGIDFWWLDWQQQMTTALPGVNPTWWLNYVHFTDQEREGKRPLLFHRWGGLGNHRYQIGFSGDTISVWDSLAFQPWFTATAANVGYAYWSHDIGGHAPGAVDPELYTRWIQFGAFSPVLRTHTTKNPDAERRIWAYPEPYSNIMRDAFQLRYALQPYIYTEARRTYDTGVAFLRPLYYDWPEAPQAYAAKSEYMFGENMFVAPVTQPVDGASQLATERIWIPEGEWIEWPTGKHFTGPLTVDRSFSIKEVPVYIRAGAIVPMQPEMRYTDQKPVDPLIINVFPMQNGQHSSYRVYEDASKSESYKQGACAWTEIDAHRAGATMEVDVHPVRGHYPGMLHARRYELRLPAGWPPTSITVNGSELNFVPDGKGAGWHYDGNTLTTIVNVPSFAATEHVHLRINRDPALVADEAELDGFEGAITRLRSAYDSLNQTSPGAWSPESLIVAMQTGDRLTFTPATANTEVGQFQASYRKALVSVEEIAQKADMSNAEKSFPAAGGHEDVKGAEDKIRRFKLLTHRALLQLGVISKDGS
jgi:alpha-glucosidase (family GH31 glycosyl hydrolase)